MPNVSLYRILDANLDRAREGLRVLEEWGRFGLNNALFAAQCKAFRQELGQWHHPAFRAARNTPGDVGTGLTHIQEQHRADIPNLLQANFSRVQEALRVLEEYGKLYDPNMGATCKQIRYEVYTLESSVLAQDRRSQLQQATLCLVTSPESNLIQIVEAALQGGCSLVQYRDKQSDDPVRFEQALALRSLCQEYKALFIINDRVDLALAVDADGVHLGQADLPVAVARELLGPHRLIGRSTTNAQELHRALDEKVDYLGVGPVYATSTKPDKAIAGLEYVHYAKTHAKIPWFAIGGIDDKNLSQVIQAGGSRVAVVRAIMQADNPNATTQSMLSQLENSGSASPNLD